MESTEDQLQTQKLKAFLRASIYSSAELRWRKKRSRRSESRSCELIHDFGLPHRISNCKTKKFD